MNRTVVSLLQQRPPAVVAIYAIENVSCNISGVVHTSYDSNIFVIGVLVVFGLQNIALQLVLHRIARGALVCRLPLWQYVAISCLGLAVFVDKRQEFYQLLDDLQ